MYLFCVHNSKVWFTCSTCHKIYSHRSNLRRHIKSTHLNFRIKCNMCDQEFRRKEYLDRHMKHYHTDMDTFSRIRDCIETEPGDFTESQSSCPEDKTTGGKDTQPDLSTFFTDMWPDDDEPTHRRNPAPKTCTVTTMTMHSRTQISISTQTDICDLPPIKTVTHTGCNTTPKFMRDKTTQQAPPLASKGTSPHCLFLDEPPMNNWEDDSSPPETPDMDIPSYFTEEFQLKREQQGLPRCTAYQGPMEEAVSEDPLPPYMSAEIPIWGVIPQSEPLVNFDLLEYMNNLCQNITPPQTSN